MTGADGLGVQRNGVRFAIHELRYRSGIRGIDIQIVSGNHIQMVPELLGPVFLLMHLRIQAFHDLDNGLGLLRALGTIRDLFELFYHLEHIATVFRHLQLLHFRIVIKLYGVFTCFHRRTFSN